MFSSGYGRFSLVYRRVQFGFSGCSVGVLEYGHIAICLCLVYLQVIEYKLDVLRRGGLLIKLAINNPAVSATSMSINVLLFGR